VLELEAGLPPVRFERDAILQVLFNLIDNALKYGRTAEDPVIRVSCRRKQGGVEIGVLDHGPGVAREHLSRILEPFYRGEAELTRRTQGAGIGLALARTLLEQMGARLQVGNVPEGGFEARVELSGGPTPA
jgi:signal transduction histidine kinase